MKIKKDLTFNDKSKLIIFTSKKEKNNNEKEKTIATNRKD